VAYSYVSHVAKSRICHLPQHLASLARIIVYSMAPDSVPVPYSNAPTPVFSPLPSGVNTPHPTASIGDYLSYSLETKTHLSVKPSAYLGGSKALDSLARMIASTESFFHPTNAGDWTTDVGAHAMLCCSCFV
jgi:proteasome activator subunit 4